MPSYGYIYTKDYQNQYPGYQNLLSPDIIEDPSKSFQSFNSNVDKSVKKNKDKKFSLNMFKTSLNNSKEENNFNLDSISSRKQNKNERKPTLDYSLILEEKETPRLNVNNLKEFFYDFHTNHKKNIIKNLKEVLIHQKIQKVR